MIESWFCCLSMTR